MCPLLRHGHTSATAALIASKCHRAFVAVTVAAIAVAILIGSSMERAHADPRDALGSYERASLDEALATQGLAIELAPEGKRVEHIRVINLDVFAPQDGFLTWFNVLHYTTRVEAVEREVLLRPGQVWDEEAIRDSVRRLRDPNFTTLAVIVPVENPRAGYIDLFVVTRDVWSLRFNSAYEFQNSTLSRLILAPSENNFLGMRKRVSAVFDMDLGDYTFGPLYVDKNLFSTNWRLIARSAPVFSREDNEFEGHRSSVLLELPLLSQRDIWAGGIEFTYEKDVTRFFNDLELRLYDNPDTPETEAIPYRYPGREALFDAFLTRVFGDAIQHRLSAGYRFSLERYEVDEDVVDPVARAAFIRDVLPRSERSSAPYLRYRLRTPTYRTYRHIDTYDLPEEFLLGPDLRAEIRLARRILGSETNHVRASARAGWTVGLLGDGFVRGLFDIRTRRQDGAFIDTEVSLQTFLATPPAFRSVRLVGRADLFGYVDDTRNSFVELGATNGLRGYKINEFDGQKRVRFNAELRTLPVPIWFTRAGILLFWDAGSTADGFDDLFDDGRLKHNIGIGLRVLVPQLQPLVFRFDFALPVGDSTGGLRFIAGDGQAF